MKRKSVFFALAMCCLALLAQQPLPQEEIARNPQLSASNSLAYQAPATAQTPAPSGKKAFYLSHYGRHGSRHLTKVKDYDYVLDALQKADEKGKLTPLGKDVLRRVKLLYQNAYGRWGDLTPLGGQQHREIVSRMMSNYPDVFKGAAHVDVRTTMVPRCVLSMTYAIQQMTKQNPKLNITFDASYHDMSYMNFQDKALVNKANNERSRKAYDAYCRRHQSWKRAMASLISDSVYFRMHFNGERVNYYLFRLAGNVQDTELRDELTLYDIYTSEELLENWRMENAYWYLGYSFSSLNGGKQPYSQRNLLRKMIQQADSCLLLPKPGAHLRFGHETMVLPLVCLMGINGYDTAVDDLELLEQKGWVNYRIVPMGCNLQLVFYRKNLQDKDVLVKVLLNEREAVLPVKTDVAPYYHWSDVREHYLKMLDAYVSEVE